MTEKPLYEKIDDKNKEKSCLLRAENESLGKKRQLLTMKYNS